MGVVMDANVLGEVCQNNKKALELLKKIKNHRVIYCTNFQRIQFYLKENPAKMQNSLKNGLLEW